MIEPPVRIENRTQLIHLLTEVAELEHGINCCYLFAAFSTKTSTDEGVTSEQLDAMKGWKDEITGIAIDEMLHLSLVNNLLTSIGSAPYLRRPNLPASPTMYPSSFQLGLRPFNEETLASFIFLERPEDDDDSSIDGTQATKRPPSIRTRDIFFDRPEYQTIGHLYRGIEDGFRYLTEKFGEEGLFVGSPESQAAEYPGLDGLTAVTDLSSAIAASETIVEQGEGARGTNDEGHYARFRVIKLEYDALKDKDPSFVPGRPVVTNPYTFAPADIANRESVAVIEDPDTASICNLFDGVYELLLQMLGRFFLRNGESEAELKLLAQSASGLMGRVLAPLGNLIMTMPFGPSRPGLNAGPSFFFSRTTAAQHQKRAAWLSWRERLSELSGYCAAMEAFGTAPDPVPQVGQMLARYSGRVGEAAEAM